MQLVLQLGCHFALGLLHAGARKKMNPKSYRLFAVLFFGSYAAVMWMIAAR